MKPVEFTDIVRNNSMAVKGKVKHIAKDDGSILNNLIFDENRPVYIAFHFMQQITLLYSLFLYSHLSAFRYTLYLRNESKFLTQVLLVETIFLIDMILNFFKRSKDTSHHHHN